MKIKGKREKERDHSGSINRVETGKMDDVDLL